jgi:hypothetical protein
MMNTQRSRLLRLCKAIFQTQITCPQVVKVTYSLFLDWHSIQRLLYAP